MNVQDFLGSKPNYLKALENSNGGELKFTDRLKARDKASKAKSS